MASFCISLNMCAIAEPFQALQLNWKTLPVLPDPLGLAAPFAGASGGAFVVAGGANFPGKPPWEGGQKACDDSIYVLTDPGGKWRSGFKLPRAVAYGVSVSTPQGIVCAGGAESRAHFHDAFLLRWTGEDVELKPLPGLPRPMANGCGALAGGIIYLAGGTESPSATNALRSFWALDLAAPDPQWRELEPWPGPARMLAVAGVAEGDFFLFSGVELSPDAAGKPVRRYLDDAYRYAPGKGWRSLAVLPRAAVAAPSPAICFQGQLLVVSGDDGRQVNFEPKSAHPGFPRNVLAYSPAKDRWSTLAADTLQPRVGGPILPSSI
jgi:N-acetylneuraminate epimerase